VALDPTAEFADEWLEEAISEERELKWPGEADGEADAALRRELRRLDRGGNSRD
jgi:hypothetical protein